MHSQIDSLSFAIISTLHVFIGWYVGLFIIECKEGSHVRIVELFCVALQLIYEVF